MADLRIVDAPVLLQESITDDVKMPTGGLGNFSVRLGDILWYVITKEQLANKNYVDLSSKGVKDSLDVHIADKANPHQVTKAQVGLGNVDNTADIDKPVSNATKSAIITATTDMATKTYVNSKDNLKADKATTLSGYGITDAHTKDETYNRDEIDDTLSMKADISYVDGKDGDLTTLTTNDKTNLVKAINEVNNNTKGVVDLYKQNLLVHPLEGWAASLLEDKSGVTQQQINDVFTIPDMFGAKANDPSFDNTDALNAAFATGKTVYGNPEDTYYVKGILNTKGQLLVGGWKISTTRHNLGIVSTDVKAVSIDKYIRTMFVESAYDLTELLHIKALGINLLTHYAHFKATPYDANGTIQNLLDNCKSVGLKVLMSTESPPSREGALGAYITNHSKHEAVWGWYAYDEPAGRNISVAIQEESIDWFRTLTDKPIAVADSYQNININPLSQKYDYVFTEGYPQGHDGDGRIQDARVDQDLQRARLSFGLMKELTKCKNIIPTLGLFTYKLPPYHCGDKVQVVRTAKEFIKAGNGNYAVFCWDSESDPHKVDNIRSTQEFKDFLNQAAMMDTKNKYVTDVLSFGGTSGDYMYGITDVLSRLVAKDANTTDANIAKNMYPAILRPSTDGTQSDRYHLISQQTYSGLVMKHEDCAVVLDMKTRKYVTCKLFYMNIASSQSAGSFQLLATSDGGYTTDVLYDTRFTNDTLFNFFSRPPKPDNNIILQMKFTQDAVGEFYRKYLTGIIVASDW